MGSHGSHARSTKGGSFTRLLEQFWCRFCVGPTRGAKEDWRPLTRRASTKSVAEEARVRLRDFYLRIVDASRTARFASCRRASGRGRSRLNASPAASRSTKGAAQPIVMFWMLGALEGPLRAHDEVVVNVCQITFRNAACLGTTASPTEAHRHGMMLRMQHTVALGLLVV